MVVTSDNPRGEEPLAVIREIEPGLAAAGLAEISGAAAGKGERGYPLIPDRREAIHLAISLARPGDAVLVAGKGHEDDQIWRLERRHFDDREEVTLGLKECHG